MKRIAIFFWVLVLLFGISAGAHAGTITVDFNLPGSVGTIVSEEYASLGVHFIPHPGGFGTDGYVTVGSGKRGNRSNCQYIAYIHGGGIQSEG